MSLRLGSASESEVMLRNGGGKSWPRKHYKLLPKCECLDDGDADERHDVSLDKTLHAAKAM